MEDGSENMLGKEPKTGDNLIPPPPPQYVKTKDLKKARRSGPSESENESLATSAASLEDDRRAQ